MQRLIYHLRLLVCLSVLLSILPVMADNAATASVTLEDVAGAHFINEMDFLRSASDVNIMDVADPDFVDQWKSYQQRSPDGLNGAESLWFRFSIDASRTTSTDWLLIIHQGIIRHAQLYLYNHDTQKWWQSRATGLNYPLSQRYYKTRNITFPIETVRDQRVTAYLNIKSSSLIAMPLSTQRADGYEFRNSIELLLVGGFLGALLIMLLYNMSLFAVLRDSLYFVYSFYIFSVIFYQLIITGIGPLYFWYSHPWMNDSGPAFFASLTFFSATLFFRFMLQLNRFGKIILSFNTFCLLLWTLAIILAFFTPKVWPFINVNSLITGVVGVSIAFYLAIAKKLTIARIFLLAWSVLIVSTGIFISALNGTVPFNSFTSYAQMFGFLSEMVLLSFALSYRINKDKRVRERAQADALQLTKRVSDERRERLRAQKETLDLQKGLNDQLENQVGQRTEQLKDALHQLESANDELKQLSVTDSLTLLHNRRFFEQAIAREYGRTQRAKQPIAVILVDIDHFKKFNDLYGHMVGDECLRQVASTLASVGRRPGDVLARYGGEEFVYVLPNSDLNATKAVAEKARAAIEKIHFVVNRQSVPLTASFGVAAWVPPTDSDYSQLIHAADTALYQAKESGRNCVTAFHPTKKASSQ